MPSVRTETTATIRYSTGGCWAARAISQADVAIRPTAHPVANAPTTAAPSSRQRTPAAWDHLGLAQLQAESRTAEASLFDGLSPGP